ncbi:hypothetical protein [Xanthomonas euroxanthea]|uniref:hypothetical protein n=1 Tax=Xanthomonas euroxanthea TaxID=2259622 RepID=UPI001609043B|nr:hypothetical protein [Xanthomonas euroxanthea]MBB5769135.1 hypothetical protein [Xanthomonas euroxanthea]
MTPIITGTELHAIAPDHSVFSDRALAHALKVQPRQIPELRRQADQIQCGAFDSRVAHLMRTCGINRHEAETYLSTCGSATPQELEGLQHG